MFGALANLSSLRPRVVLLCALVFGVVAGVVGAPAAQTLSNDRAGFFDPRSESFVAAERLAVAEGANPAPDVLALVTPEEGPLSPGGRAEVLAAARRFEQDPAVARVMTAYDTDDPAMVSRDGEAALVVVRFDPDADKNGAARRLSETFGSEEGVKLGGPAMVAYEALETVERDLVRAELLALPLLFALLVWVFRGVVAAALPLLAGVLSVAGALAALRVLAGFAPISVFALNVVTGLGLGLAVDYGLLLVSRYREELARPDPGCGALRRTLATAGRTVFFSSLTVAAALASLLVFPLAFLRSLAIGGVLVALLSGAVALVALPALLALLGEMVNALSPRRWRRLGEEEARSVEGRWYRAARFVTRRPLLVAAAASALLVALALPALDLRYTSVQASSLPPGSEARRVSEAVERDFPGGGAAPIFVAVAVPGGVVQTDAGEHLRAYAARLEGLPDVAGVATPRPAGEGVWRIDVLPAAGPFSSEARALVEGVRDAEAPYRADVGGQTAEFLDQQESIARGLPLALAVVFVATFALLFFATRSAVLPVKTFVMNTFTVAATFGALVWIFQDGRFEDLLGYRSQGALENTQPIVVVVLAFGLATDFGVILLSRIREARDAGSDDREAVAIGLARTGRVVTAAALLFCVAVGAFATSGLVFVKELGIGAALAVLIDATVVRALLVPSLMTLLGRLNWWAPRFLSSSGRLASEGARGSLLAGRRPLPRAVEPHPGPGPASITVDLDREQHRTLERFALGRDVEGGEVVRALLEELRDDPRLVERLTERMGAHARRRTRESEGRVDYDVIEHERGGKARQRAWHCSGGASLLPASGSPGCDTGLRHKREDQRGGKGMAHDGGRGR